MPSFSPSAAQGCGEAHRQSQQSQQSHQTSWHLSSSALAAAANLQPLPSSWSRSLHVGERWERPASCVHSVPTLLLALGASEHLPLLTVNNRVFSLSLAKRLQD